MTPEQLIAWAQAAQLLARAGLVTAATLKAIFAAGGLSEDEQNAILDTLIANSRMRKGKSKAIADGTI